MSIENQESSIAALERDYSPETIQRVSEFHELDGTTRPIYEISTAEGTAKVSFFKPYEQVFATYDATDITPRSLIDQDRKGGLAPIKRTYEYSLHRYDASEISGLEGAKINLMTDEFSHIPFEKDPLKARQSRRGLEKSVWYHNLHANEDSIISVVEAAPAALIDFIIEHGGSDERLRSARQAYSAREANADLKDVLNDLVALKLFAAPRDSEEFSESFQAEAIFIQAMLGNMEAVDVLEAARHEFHDSFDQAKLSPEAKRKLDGFVAVKITSTKLLRRRDGRYTSSTFRDTGGQKNTSHWSLNHHVASHNQGSWDDRPFAIVAPLGNLIEENGAPKELRGEDTWFECYPFEGCLIPEGYIFVAPRGNSGDQLLTESEKEGFTEIGYKSSGFTTEDAKLIMAQLSKGDVEKYKGGMTKSASESFREHISQGEVVIDDAVEQLLRYGAKRIAVEAAVQNMGGEVHEGYHDGVEEDFQKEVYELATVLGVGTRPHFYSYFGTSHGGGAGAGFRFGQVYTIADTRRNPRLDAKNIFSEELKGHNHIGIHNQDEGQYLGAASAQALYLVGLL